MLTVMLQEEEAANKGRSTTNFRSFPLWAGVKTADSNLPHAAASHVFCRSLHGRMIYLSLGSKLNVCIKTANTQIRADRKRSLIRLSIC